MSKKELIDSFVRSAHERGVFTGTWLYAENGNIVSKGAVGWQDPEDKIPMREDTRFGLACVGKQFTAAAILLLGRDGLLDLEDDVTKFFPEIPYQGITVRHLLNHTSGLPAYDDWLADAAEECPALDSGFILRFLKESGEEPSFAPGEAFEYSNTGYCLLARIIEKASGMAYGAYLQERIFAPAGMASTSLRRPNDNLAAGMESVLGAARWEPAEMLPDEELDGGCGGGMIWSDIFDLLAWDKALREGTVLTREEQNLMLTPGTLAGGELPDSDGIEFGEAYGFGWFLDSDPNLGRVACHNGCWAGYFNWIERLPDAGRFLILLGCRENLDGRADEAFQAGIREIIKDREPEPVFSIEELALKDPDRSGWEALTGKYDFEGKNFRIDGIVLKDGDLYAEAVWGGEEYELKMFPLEGGAFGIKDLDGEITFDEDGLNLWGEAHRKL